MITSTAGVGSRGGRAAAPATVQPGRRQAAATGAAQPGHPPPCETKSVPAREREMQVARSGRSVGDAGRPPPAPSAPPRPRGGREGYGAVVCPRATERATPASPLCKGGHTALQEQERAAGTGSGASG